MAEGQPRVNGKFVKKNGGPANGNGIHNIDGFPAIGGSPDEIDPTALENGIDGSTTSGPEKRKPGRPKKDTSPGKEKTDATLDLSAIETTLFSIHALLAAIVSEPLIMISDDESKTLAIGIKNVARHYDLRTTQKSMDWGLFAIALGTVYGPKIATVISRKKQKQNESVPFPAN